MAREKKTVRKVVMTEEKRNIIQQLLQEYIIQSAEDIQEALKGLLEGAIKIRWMSTLAIKNFSVRIAMITAMHIKAGRLTAAMEPWIYRFTRIENLRSSHRLSENFKTIFHLSSRRLSPYTQKE